MKRILACFLLVALVSNCIQIQAEEETKTILNQEQFVQKKAGKQIASEEIDFEHLEQYFVASKIKKGDEIYNRINGKSYKKNKYIKLSDLRYLKVLHYNYKHEIRVGELIVNKKIVSKIKTIFRKLFQKEYEIKKMYLIEKYWTKNDPNESDDASCDAGNTSAFCYRVMTDGKKLSYHAKGMAIDINTRENPYAIFRNGKWRCEHKNALKYLNRKKVRKHMITKKDYCYKLFKKAGFKWGGSWTNPKDYQHFEMH